MPVTYDQGFPSEIAALVDTFNRAADGYDIDHVIQAATNFFIVAIHGNCKAKNLSLAQAQNVARNLCEQVVEDIAVQWNRQSQPTDIVFKQN